jgi:hypothetical protein
MHRWKYIFPYPEARTLAANSGVSAASFSVPDHLREPHILMNMVRMYHAAAIQCVIHSKSAIR